MHLVRVRVGVRVGPTATLTLALALNPTPNFDPHLDDEVDPVRPDRHRSVRAHDGLAVDLALEGRVKGRALGEGTLWVRVGGRVC